MQYIDIPIKGRSRLLLIFSSFLFLAGCAGFERARDLKQAQAIAQRGGLHHQLIMAQPFAFTAFVKEAKKIKNQPYAWAVFIEGDGFAWRTRSQPSPNPTPEDPIGLKLAASFAKNSPDISVLYLARPCQYTDPDRNPACHSRYWTSHRYAEEVVNATDAAISKVIPNGAKLHFWGYSGGAALAVLVAARRDDVASINSVAGNLDPGALNTFHRVSPLNDSLDPVRFAISLAGMPQTHYVGERDTVVPPFIAENWKVKSGSPKTIVIKVVPGARHHDGWPDPISSR